MIRRHGGAIAREGLLVVGALVARLQGAEQIDGSRAVVDSASVGAVLGAKQRSLTATGIQNRLLEVNESRTASYRVPVPAVAAGPVEVAVDVVAEIPIFDMAEAARTVTVR